MGVVASLAMAPLALSRISSVRPGLPSALLDDVGQKNPTTHPEQEPDPQNDVHRYLTSTQEQLYYTGPSQELLSGIHEQGAAKKTWGLPTEWAVCVESAAEWLRGLS